MISPLVAWLFEFMAMNVLLVNQCFYPDVVSSGQHLTDLAVALTERGHTVTVVTSSRGYDNPKTRFSRHEKWRGVRIIRILTPGFGKKSRWRRALDFGGFIASCAVQFVLLPRFDVTVAMTSPPLISWLAALFVQIKGGRLLFWVMDLNPDEAVAAAWLSDRSMVTKILERALRYSLQKARKVVVLDRFMKQRLHLKGVSEDKMMIIPPWSHDDAVHYDPVGRKDFRTVHKLSKNFVAMYSGNLSPCHPLDTLLQAALGLKDHPEIIFCFIGGGSEFDKVKAFMGDHLLANIICLPYQPLDRLSASLSSADMHIVVMGNPFPGIVHPCKIYNILLVGAPILYIGPPESHVMDILTQINSRDMLRTARHGDPDTVVNHILDEAHGGVRFESRNNVQVATPFSKQVLLPRLIGCVELLCMERIPDENGGSEGQTP